MFCALYCTTLEPLLSTIQIEHGSLLLTSGDEKVYPTPSRDILSSVCNIVNVVMGYHTPTIFRGLSFVLSLIAVTDTAVLRFGAVIPYSYTCYIKATYNLHSESCVSSM